MRLTHKHSSDGGIGVLILVVLAIVAVLIIGAKIISVILSLIDRCGHRVPEPDEVVWGDFGHTPEPDFFRAPVRRRSE
jgi:hypothetical protein